MGNLLPGSQGRPQHTDMSILVLRETAVALPTVLHHIIIDLLVPRGSLQSEWRVSQSSPCLAKIRRIATDSQHLYCVCGNQDLHVLCKRSGKLIYRLDHVLSHHTCNLALDADEGGCVYGLSVDNQHIIGWHKATGSVAHHIVLPQTLQDVMGEQAHRVPWLTILPVGDTMYIEDANAGLHCAIGIGDGLARQPISSSIGSCDLYLQHGVVYRELRQYQAPFATSMPSQDLSLAVQDWKSLPNHIHGIHAMCSSKMVIHQHTGGHCLMASVPWNSELQRYDDSRAFVLTNAATHQRITVDDESLWVVGDQGSILRYTD